jgi:hypothetical protein
VATLLAARPPKVVIRTVLLRVSCSGEAYLQRMTVSVKAMGRQDQGASHVTVVVRNRLSSGILRFRSLSLHGHLAVHKVLYVQYVRLFQGGPLGPWPLISS